MKIVVTAVPGCGKTTTLNYLERMMDVNIINFGDFMFKYSKLKNRDDMRKLPVEKYRKLQLSASKKIGKMKGNIVIDTHCTINKPEGYYPGLPEDVLKSLSPDVIVLIEKNPQDILKQRKRDKKRTTRDIETLGKIELQQQMNRMFAAAYSTIAKSTVKIISLRYKERSAFQHSKIAAKQIAELFKGD